MFLDWPAPSSGHVSLAAPFPPDRPLLLASGQSLDTVQVAYETYGRLDSAGDNAVFICHALTGDSHVARHDSDDVPGWWETMVGPGRPVDTSRYFVICANVLGGCAGTTGPWLPGPGGAPTGARFPEVTVGDMVTVHRELLAGLGITRLHAVVGGSLGGMQALEWLLRYPQDADGFMVVAATARQSADNLAWNAVARHAIRNDRGHPGPGAGSGLGTARMIAHLTYLSERSLERKFGRAPRRAGTRRHPPSPERGDYAVEGYLEHQAEKFLRRFDAESYLRLLGAMDRFDAFAGAGRPRQAGPPPEVFLYSFTQDRLFGPAHSEHIQAGLAARGQAARHLRNDADDTGHDAFLLDVPSFLRASEEFLGRLGTRRRSRHDGLVPR
ncbi:homoserine O-acetyltransferase [Streptomyces sp. NPDC102402]|uniref:homoserine O-acetyltransferase MetX n=1 Tax=Streptomyces sp. NPDC102402 TaxID=3366169 RepID=UPI0037F91C2D